MALKIQSYALVMGFARCERLNRARDARAIAAHPSLNNLLHFRAESLIIQTLERRASFLGHHVNLEG